MVMRFFNLSKGVLWALVMFGPSLGVMGAADQNKLDEHQNKLDERIRKLTDRFELIAGKSRTKIPGYVLRRAQGIVIFQEFEAGLLIGVRGGNGIALARDPKTGKWSFPSFVKTGKGSFGLQAGGHEISAVMVVLDSSVMRQLARARFKIGVNAAATGGPVGVEADTRVGLPPIVVYSNATGLFAGVSIEGGVLTPGNKANERYYRMGGVTMYEILYEGTGAETPTTQRLLETIGRYERD